nr:DUF4367 domain-containing protein [[Clostridium] symbiosum]
MDQLLKESFRMDDKTLLERFQRAQTEIDDSQIPPEPEDGFERLLEKIEPRYTRDSTPEKKFRKIRRLKPIFKVAMVAGVIVMILLATTITAGAKKYFVYRKTVRPSIRNDVVLDNDRNVDKTGKLEDAYLEIEEEIGIVAIRMAWMPSGMVYSKTYISEQAATMTFDYQGNSFFIKQKIKDVTDSTNIISDRKEKDMVFSKWINQYIEVQKRITNEGETEYSAEFIRQNSYYYLAGIMEREDFDKIIENLYLEKGED